MAKEPPSVFTPKASRLYLICAVGFLCSTMDGYNGSLLNGLLQNDAFKAYFDGSNSGVWVGLVGFLYQIGGLAGLPFSGPSLDAWGRRKGIFIAVCTIIMGTAIQGTSAYTHSMRQFMIGRLFLGFGAQIAGAGGPIYLIELSHPAHRGVITALFNTFW